MVSVDLGTVVLKFKITDISGGTQKVEKEKSFQWIVYIALGVELAFSILAGLILGQYIDAWMTTGTPWFTLIGLVAGAVAGFTIAYKMIKKLSDKKP